MTQRSILAGQRPNVIVRAGWDVTVTGWESDRVLAGTESVFGLKVKRHGDVVEVEIGASGEVRVPLHSALKVYTGKSAGVSNLAGSAVVYAGWNVQVRQVQTLIHASSGGAMDVECETVEGDDVKFTAGRDIRFYVRRLTDVTYKVKDLGGPWEAVIGLGQTRVSLTAGGDVTLVTDQDLVGQPPDYVIGKTERPDAAASAGGDETL